MDTETESAEVVEEPIARRITRMILGAWFIAFGVLKYAVPWIWDNWTAQVEQSGLPLGEALLFVGPLVEIAAGVALLIKRFAVVGAGLVIVSMVTAIFVHYQVDSAVLPMGMQFPLLPLIAIGMGSFVLVRRPA